MDWLTLPTEEHLISKIMRDHRDRCLTYYAWRRMTWALAWHYMQGIRNFKVWDPMNRRLVSDILDDQGRMEFVGQTLLKHANDTAGLLQNLDLRPKADSIGNTLEAQRSRAISQVFADAVAKDDHIRDVKRLFAWNLSCLGFCGIQGHTEVHPMLGLTGSIEVVHPRELYPFPLTGEDVSKVRGLMRIHYVSKSHLEDQYGKRKINSRLADLEWWESMAGNAFDQIGENESTMYWTQGRGMPRTSFTSEARGNAKETGKDTVGVVRVMRLWLLGERNTVLRYVCGSGNMIFEDINMKGMEAYCPINYARLLEDGTFHGQGIFDLLFSTVRKGELLEKYLYTSTMDTEKFPIMLLPQGQFNQNQMLQDVGRGLRVMFYDPDPTSIEGMNPLLIAPFNPGDIPGRVAQFAQERVKDLSPVRDLLSEKGRVDSAAGLGVLQEQITQAMTVATANVVACWGNTHRAMVQRGAFEVVGEKVSVPVNTLTLDLAGAVIQDGRVSFPENPLPDMSLVSFTIRGVSPKNTVARKQEALQLWQFGVEQDPVSFKLQAIKEGLDFPMWMDEEIGAYNMAVQTILTLFNDGEQPGPVILTPYMTRPEIFLRILNGFITGPLAQKASVAVMNSLGMLRDTLVSFMGLSLPAAIPNPDDAAMLSMGMTGAPQGTAPSVPQLGQGGGEPSGDEP